MKRLCATISLVAIAIATSACGENAAEGDCGAQFKWDGVEYHGMGVPRVKLDLGEQLGDGTVRGCADEPAAPVNVFPVAGVDPEIGVAVSYKESPRDLVLWGRPGYIVESPEHPLHDAVFLHTDEPDDRAGYRCDAPRSLRAQVTGLPQPLGNSLRVRSTRGNEDVNVDAHTRIRGAERHGIPFVEINSRCGSSSATASRRPRPDPARKAACATSSTRCARRLNANGAPPKRRPVARRHITVRPGRPNRCR